MTDTKFTPGPWVAYDRGIGWEIHKGGEALNVHFRDTFSRPDANLIAAAPDLYAALESVLNFRLEDGSTISCPQSIAALKKARGENV